MDAFNAVKHGGCLPATIGCLCCLAFTGAGVAFVSYLGIYALNNPDLPAWYGVSVLTGKEGLYATDLDFGLDTVTNLDDVHGNFVTWFMWGFMNAMITFGLMLLGGIFMLCSPAIGNCLLSLVGCVQCSGLAWWIAGMVWRLRASGKYASGDVMPENVTDETWTAEITAEGSLFQVQSGNFMWIYYMITWILMGVSCGCGLLATIVGMCCGAVKSHY